STAFFLPRRFVIPNLIYHMQAWGLHADPQLWEEVDGVLTEFTALLCPLDLRDALAQNSALRAELALPQRFGGLSIPIVGEQAPIRAAEQWDYEDAKETGVGAGVLAAAYRPEEILGGVAYARRHKALGIDGFA